MFLNYVLKDEIIFSLGFCFKNNHTGWGRWVEAQQKQAWLLMYLVSAEGAWGVHDPILLFLHMFEISKHKITSKSTVLQKTLVSTHPASSFFY